VDGPGRMVSSRSAQRWVLAVTGAASFVVALDALVVSTALSTIRSELDASIEQLEWTVNAYVLSLAVLLMPAAALGDRLGRRRLFAAGLGLFAAASALCALAPDIDWLLAGRALQGTGAALVMPLALALLGAGFPPDRRGWALGVFSGVTGLAVLCGPPVGGAVVEGISWPWIFWLNVPIALLLSWLARTRIQESLGPRIALDLGGLALVTSAAFAVVWGLMRGSVAGWRGVEVVAALALGALLTAALVGWELRASQPMLPLGLFRSRGFSAGNTAVFFWWASGLGALFLMAQFLETALGQGPLEAGLALMPWGAMTFIAPQLAGRLIGRLGERPFVTGGLVLQAGCMAWIALLAAPDLAYWQLIAPLTLSGAGIAVAIPGIQSIVIGSVSPQHVGKASGTLSTLRQLGGVFGVAVVAAVFAGAGGYASPQAFSDGFSPAIGAAGTLALVGAFAGLALPSLPAATDVAATPAVVQAETRS
jgi:EmrB/QacA subfamily drug resistance transporter